MFCNTFYCPYAKYILKDIEAFCSLLSLADKSKKSSSDAMYNEKHSLQSIVCIIFQWQTSRTPAYAPQDYFIYTVFSSGGNLMLVVHIVMTEIYSNHIYKKYPCRLTFTLFWQLFISQDPLRAMQQGCGRCRF